MNILVINGSPRGPHSSTLQTCLYGEALHPEHRFTVIHAAQRIKSLAKDLTPLREALEEAELVLFSYPVYTFLLPSQLQELLELIRAGGVELRGKFMSQISGSKHFYDITAHRYLEENCFDLGMKVIRGLSADMDDLLSPRGQEEARMFFEQLFFSCEHGIFVTPPPAAPRRERSVYAPCLPAVKKKPGRDIVIVSNAAGDDENLRNMIADFQAALPYASRVVNIRDFPFAGGCLGCMSCAADGQCIYKDGFTDFLRREVQSADALIYAFTIENHYTHHSFKRFDDRQFCNGHRTVTRGKAVGYILSGDYRREPNLRTLLEARSEVGGLYLCGVATDEENTAGALSALAAELAFALEKQLRRPPNFYGVGGMKIFRDLIYVTRGLMREDHRFYKKNGIYDFPQKQKKRILQLQLVGTLMRLPGAGKMRGRMNAAITAPYRKVVEAARNSGGNKPPESGL